MMPASPTAATPCSRNCREATSMMRGRGASLCPFSFRIVCSLGPPHCVMIVILYYDHNLTNGWHSQVPDRVIHAVLAATDDGCKSNEPAKIRTDRRSVDRRQPGAGSGECRHRRHNGV